MKKGGDPFEYELEIPESSGQPSAEVEDDITAFDPFGAEARPADPSAPLRLDFSELLTDPELRGARSVGASALDTNAFVSSEEREALARARKITAEKPAIVELEEERQGATRVVAENRMPYLWAALGVVVLAGLVAAGLWVLHGRRQAQMQQEVERLLEAERGHRARDIGREAELSR